MNKDIDKLPHGPEFDLYDIDTFDGQRPRTQFMVSCNIIQAVRDLFANQFFKKYFHAAPEQHWLSPRKDQRVYSEMRTANDRIGENAGQGPGYNRAPDYLERCNNAVDHVWRSEGLPRVCIRGCVRGCAER